MGRSGSTVESGISAREITSLSFPPDCQLLYHQCLTGKSRLKEHWLAVGARHSSTSRSAVLAGARLRKGRLLSHCSQVSSPRQASSSACSRAGAESTQQCLSTPEGLLSLWNSAGLDLYPDLLNVLHDKIRFPNLLCSHHYSGTNGFLWPFVSFSQKWKNLLQLMHIFSFTFSGL